MTRRARWGEIRPEVGRCWIRFVPTGWPATAAPWTALDRLGLGEPGIGFDLSAWVDRPLDGVAWLPPTPASLAEERAGLIRAHLDRGTPVLSQRLATDPPAPAPAVDVLDLLATVVGGEDVVAAAAGVGPGGVVLLPLVPGLAGDEPRWVAIAQAARAAGAAAVMPVVLDLEPVERRRLVEIAGEDLFEPIFHGSAPSEREVARVLVAQGVAIWPPRPLPQPPQRGAHNVRLAGYLIEAAEFGLRLGRPETWATACFTAARFLDATHYDVPALVRDGVAWAIPELAAEPVRELVAGGIDGEPAGLVALRREWTGAAAPAGG
jgi:hypothetical protein